MHHLFQIIPKASCNSRLSDPGQNLLWKILSMKFFPMEFSAIEIASDLALNFTVTILKIFQILSEHELLRTFTYFSSIYSSIKIVIRYQQISSRINNSISYTFSCIPKANQAFKFVFVDRPFLLVQTVYF